MQIPRCRATVSEETRGRSLGRIPILGRTPHSTEPARALTRKPGDRRKPSPTTLSREKENGMRKSPRNSRIPFTSCHRFIIGCHPERSEGSAVARTTTAARHPTPARALLVACLLLAVSAFAADLKVKVVDPQSADVPNAQLQLIRPSDQTIVATQTTSAEGQATFHIEDSAATPTQSPRPRLRRRNPRHLRVNPTSPSISASPPALKP